MATPSIREQILVAAAATVEAALTGVPVYRSRVSPLDRDECPAINIQAHEEAVTTRAGGGPTYGVVQRDLEFGVKLYVRNDAPETTADPILVSMHAALMKDPTLGNLCATLIELGTTWEEVEADATGLEADVRYIARYLTARTLLNQAP